MKISGNFSKTKNIFKHKNKEINKEDKQVNKKNYIEDTFKRNAKLKEKANKEVDEYDLQTGKVMGGIYGAVISSIGALTLSQVIENSLFALSPQVSLSLIAVSGLLGLIIGAKLGIKLAENLEQH